MTFLAAYIGKFYFTNLFIYFTNSEIAEMYNALEDWFLRFCRFYPSTYFFMIPVISIIDNNIYLSITTLENLHNVDIETELSTYYKYLKIMKYFILHWIHICK